MTVTATNSADGPYLTNGVTTSFPYTFAAFENDEVAVAIDGVTVSSSLYTVTRNAGDEGGTVTFLVAPEAGGSLVPFMDPNFGQDIAFTNAGPFLASSHDEALDRGAQRAIFLRDGIARSLRAPAGEELAVLPSDRANQYLSFDDDGNPVASPGTGSDIGFIQSGGGTVRSSQAKLLEMPASVADFASGVAGFIAAAAASASLFVPAAAHAIASDVTISDGFSWRADPAASISGAGNVVTPDLVGFYYTPNLKHTRIVEAEGSIASPDTTTHPLMTLSRHSNTAYDGTANATLVVQHYKWGAGTDARGQAIYAEAIAKAGGASSFVEGIRAHGIIPVGITAKAYGLIAYAENNGAGINTVGIEGEVSRIGGVDAGDPYNWVDGQQFDAAVLGTVRLGHKILGLFVANPYNVIQAQAAFLIPNSYAAQGVARTIVNYGFACYEDNLVAAMIVRGSNLYACMMMPNASVIIRALNGAGNANHDIFRYSSDNLVHVGTEAVGVKAYGAIYFGLLANFANDAAAATGGVGVGQLYRNGSVVMQRAA